MMALLLLVLGLGNAGEITLYDSSQGRLGLELMDLPSPTSCMAGMGNDVPKWKQCQNSARELFELHPEAFHYAIWATIAALRAGDIAGAFDEFEPLLPFLEMEWKEEYWSIVALESWLLFEVGLDREARILLREIPDTSLAAAGKYILLYTEVYSERTPRRQKKIWEQMTRQGHLTAWTWWHKIRLSKQSTHPVILQRMLKSKYVGPIQYVDAIDYYRTDQKWQGALLVALKGLSLFPDSKQLYKEAVLIANNEEGERALLNYLDRFPEHTKALLVQSFVLMMDHQFERAWAILELAKEYGEHSDFFWGLREDVSYELSEELYFQVLKEGLLAHPNDDAWSQKIEVFEKRFAN